MKGMKGLELPLNMIVLIIIAVLVLVVVAAFFAGYIGTGQNSIAASAAFSTGCNTLRQVYSCNSASVSAVQITGYNPSNTPIDQNTKMPTTGQWGNLQQACHQNFGNNQLSDADCARACSC